MIEITDKTKCSGCWACENICPKQCITMEEDSDGFRYPVVDLNLCINCHLCERVCPEINPHPRNENPQNTAYVAQNKNDEILRESTSGGVFTAIAKYVIGKGGIVYGAGFDKDMNVVHQKAETVDELGKFRNSKYVQSLVGETLKQVKSDLATGRLVCFSGTPCQLEGLLNYLRKPYDNLITVDVVCRGVPSPLVLRKYLECQQSLTGKEATKVRFRDKWYGYKYSAMTLGNDKGTYYHEGIDTDYYLRSFFSGVNLRPSCSECPFRAPNRATDFTIWDCFDVDKFSRELDNDKGVTRILAHTNRAREILKQCEADLRIVEMPYEKAIEGVKEFSVSPKLNPQRDKFFEELATTDACTAFASNFPVTMKHKLEKRARLLSNSLGIYKQMKRFYKFLHGKGEIKR